MNKFPVVDTSLSGVFSVPPLARAAGKNRRIDFEQNSRIVRHIAEGGITRFIYGGNAFLYHVTLAEYEELLQWLADMGSHENWFIPSAGPSYGRLMDQAALLRSFPSLCDGASLCRSTRRHWELSEACESSLKLPRSN